MTPELIASRIHGIEPEDILAIYQYGSRVYGTHNENSDTDLIVVTNGKLCGQEFRVDFDIHTVSEDKFKENLDKHKIRELECYFSTPLYFTNNWQLSFKLDKGKLRQEISSKCSNSFVKAKKKMEIDYEDDWIGVKSLFHSIRMADFGIQIAENGKIVDYGSCNELWNEIKDQYHAFKSWEHLKSVFKPRYNAVMTKFREVAPKE